MCGSAVLGTGGHLYCTLGILHPTSLLSTVSEGDTGDRVMIWTQSLLENVTLFSERNKTMKIDYAKRPDKKRHVTRTLKMCPLITSVSKKALEISQRRCQPCWALKNNMPGKEDNIKSSVSRRKQQGLQRQSHRVWFFQSLKWYTVLLPIKFIFKLGRRADSSRPSLKNPTILHAALPPHHPFLYLLLLSQIHGVYDKLGFIPPFYHLYIMWCWILDMVP